MSHRNTGASADENMKRNRSKTPIAPLLCAIAFCILALFRYVADESRIGLAFSVSLAVLLVWAAWWLTAVDEDKGCPRCGKLNSFDDLICTSCGGGFKDKLPNSEVK